MDSELLMNIIFSILALLFLFIMHARKWNRQQRAAEASVKTQSRQDVSLKQHAHVHAHKHRLHHSQKVVVQPPKVVENQQSSKRAAVKDAPVYEVNRKVVRSRGQDLLQELSSRRKMLVYKEIFDQPLALRKPVDERL